MFSVAVFVDAGYLFAQGSYALSGSNVPRSQLKLESTAAVTTLTKIAEAKSNGSRLLRIYWYDGSASGRLSLDQSALANADNVKLRLGQINSAGQQKGVDSLIVTDLIELARNHAITDAVLLSGDEDVRIGVQIAQSFGVRVHLIGIHAGKSSQSPSMLQEADTTSLLGKAEVAAFLSIKIATPPIGAPTSVPVATPKPQNAGGLEQLATDVASKLDEEQVKNFAEFRKHNKGVPSEFDGKLIAKGRDLLKRDLDQNEKRNLRARFIDAVKARKPDLFSS